MRLRRWVFLLVAMPVAAVLIGCESVETLTSKLTPPPTYTLYPTYTPLPASTAANGAGAVQDPSPTPVEATKAPDSTTETANTSATAMPVGADTPRVAPEATPETPEVLPEATPDINPDLPTPTPEAVNVLRLEVTSGKVGDRVGVSLFLEKAQDVAAVQLDVRFDPGVLEGLTADSLGAITQEHQLSHRFDNESGSVRLILISLTGSVLSGTGEIALLSFNVLAPGQSPLELSGVLLSDVAAQPITRFVTVDGLVVGQ
ncbi:MAG: hypothetical protein BZY88_15355 [SAR202 cluster bacterium Io17-Chloro-G9]|nr:MAG: hypothetical protein BZY88_15355 [SAR202 cluster bacterium Io17-Chloro-G9]